MENQNVKGGWSKATLVFGIIAMVMVIMPLISGWFVFLMPVNWCIIIPAGVICAIVALIKKQNLVKTLVGVALCVLAWFMPDMLVEQYAELRWIGAGLIRKVLPLIIVISALRALRRRTITAVMQTAITYSKIF